MVEWREPGENGKVSKNDKNGLLKNQLRMKYFSSNFEVIKKQHKFLA